MHYLQSLGMPETLFFTIYGDKEQKLKQLTQAAAKKGISLIGDTTSGTFSGMLGLIAGNYAISGNQLRVNIINRPPLVSLETIRNGFQAFLNS